VGGVTAAFVTIPNPVGVLEGGLSAGVQAIIASAYHRRWLLVGLAAVSGLAGALWTGLAVGFARPGAGKTSPLDPRASWRRDRIAGLVRGLAIGLTVVVGLAVGGGLVGVLRPGLRLGLAVAAALGVGLLAGLAGSATWPASLAFAQLAIRLHSPVRLMRFLNDAHDRGVLRAVGPVYQFRHAGLQDRLAVAAQALEEVQALKELLADRLRVKGPDHPDVLTTRHNLAYWRWQAGDAAGAAQALEELLADRLRVQGPDHPGTVRTQATLASLRGQDKNSQCGA
jgi:hypothetical protein